VAQLRDREANLWYMNGATLARHAPLSLPAGIGDPGCRRLQRRRQPDFLLRTRPSAAFLWFSTTRPRSTSTCSASIRLEGRGGR
jgi:hypothetical protein